MENLFARTKAYNPYCASNSNWSCPLPPIENRLKAEGPEERGIRIEAGEKKFHD
ncbi:MAG: DUF1684 domain-containing protein [Chloroflexi bacterium]|nr:DUF1684 domain-containing protein [Chloroflexota bacterium]